MAGSGTTAELHWNRLLCEPKEETRQALHQQTKTSSSTHNCNFALYLLSALTNISNNYRGKCAIDCSLNIPIVKHKCSDLFQSDRRFCFAHFDSASFSSTSVKLVFSQQDFMESVLLVARVETVVHSRVGVFWGHTPDQTQRRRSSPNEIGSATRRDLCVSSKTLKMVRQRSPSWRGWWGCWAAMYWNC